jgi:hypothetical protein
MQVFIIYIAQLCLHFLLYAAAAAAATGAAKCVRKVEKVASNKL